MNVEVYDYDGLGYIIDPESDTKIRTVILIGKQTVKCNPRQAVIYFSSEKIDEGYAGLERLKKYCDEHKVVLVCPKDRELATLEATYKYLFKNHLEVNIKRDELAICIESEAQREEAEGFRTYLLEEYDVEMDEITVLGGDRELKIPYGRSEQTLKIGECQILASKIQELSACADEHEAVKDAMANPYGSFTLRELAAGKEKVVLIISDHTRPVPSKFIVPHMLEEIREGNKDADITLLVATGCHRGTTTDELVDKLGKEIVEKEKIVVHDCVESPLSDIGDLPSGARLVVNSLVTEADLVVAEGFIEPHFFAGYSGGRKSILPGVCSRKTVLGNHCAKFIDDENARMGVLLGNPINRDMEAAVRMAGLAYIVNVVINEEKQIVAAFAGDPIEAHHAGCRYLAKYCLVKTDMPGDIVITSNGGAPLDQNVYQAVKGITTADAAAGEGAVIIMCAECADGIGGDVFYNALSGCRNVTELLEEIRSTPMDETVPDQWQYQILAKIMERHHIIFVTEPEMKEKITDMKMEYSDSLEHAFARAKELKGEDASVTVIPNGISLVLHSSF